MKYENSEGDKNISDSRNFSSLFLKGKILSFQKKKPKHNNTAKWERGGTYLNRKEAVSSVWGVGNEDWKQTVSQKLDSSNKQKKITKKCMVM